LPKKTYKIGKARDINLKMAQVKSIEFYQNCQIGLNLTMTNVSPKVSEAQKHEQLIKIKIMAGTSLEKNNFPLRLLPLLEFFY